MLKNDESRLKVVQKKGYSIFYALTIHSEREV